MANSRRLIAAGPEADKAQRGRENIEQLRAIARAGIVNFRFHDLRHSCASALVQNGANLAEVATLLGHKGLAMTLRYSHVGNAGTSRLVDRVMGDVA